MNIFFGHFLLHEFFFGFFPTPPITFLMVRPLSVAKCRGWRVATTSRGWRVWVVGAGAGKKILIKIKK